MKDRYKEQLANEAVGFHQRVDEMETSKAECKNAEEPLHGYTKRLKLLQEIHSAV